MRGTRLWEVAMVAVLTLQCAAKPDRWSVGTAAHAPLKGLTCASRGQRAYSRAYVRTTHTARNTCAQNADHLAHNRPFSALFAEVVCTVGTTPTKATLALSPNGGNDVIRTTTRRRHAASQLLMLQNPHRHRHEGHRRNRRARRPENLRVHKQQPAPHSNT